HTLIFGSEPHTPKMAKRIRTLLGVRETFDITGLTELYGPGAGQECRAHQGIHYWADKYILEILDPETLQPVPEGEVGEMVVTTLTKEAAPLIRYRTRDLTRLVPGPCPCGLSMPRHDRIFGRSDDMFIFRGVNIYPGQIADVLERHPEVGPEYRIHLQRRDGLDSMTVQVERRPESEPAAVDPAPALARDLHKHLMARAEVQVLDPGQLPRTFSKTKRVLDERYEDAAD
ncbi:MAG: phenylacetate--CoA ligase family protein, partial [Deltaproteobacteria bacterium]|nr:phenylacetate--CoA ligase family protein [Deltaproteobacteria bacterium]